MSGVTVAKSNVLQPLDGGSRNQNLLKLNVTSARADSTEGDAENVAISDAATSKGRKSSQGRGKAKAKSPKNEKNWMEADKQVLGSLQIVKHHHSVKKFQTPSVSRRNARERNRVKQVNSGFNILKHHVPNLKNKTSKVDTLRAAVDYIKTLREMIGEPLDESNLHQGPILITEVDDVGQDVSSTVTDTSGCDSPDISLDVVNVSDSATQHHNPSPTPGGHPPQGGLASMVYQLPPINMNFAYAPPPPCTPSPASSNHSGESSRPPTLSHDPYLTLPTSVIGVPSNLVTTLSPALPPPCPEFSPGTGAVTAGLSYNLLPAIDILRNSAASTGAPWDINHHC